MTSITVNEIDEFHRMNPKFRDCETVYTEFLIGNGVNLHDAKPVLDVHASNERFELKIDTQMLNWELANECSPDETTNYLIIDGVKRRLSEYDSWTSVSEAIKSVL